MDMFREMPDVLHTTKGIEEICTACKGTGDGWEPFPSNTRVLGDVSHTCRYCDGTGTRQTQIFNWMKEDYPEKYLKRPIKVNKKKVAKKRKL